MTSESPLDVNVLLVDDLQENLVALEALIRQPGRRIFSARSGEQALSLMLEHSFALAILDVQMPSMNGFELAELMRGTERTRGIPIVFVSAVESLLCSSMAGALAISSGWMRAHRRPLGLTALVAAVGAGLAYMVVDVPVASAPLPLGGVCATSRRGRCRPATSRCVPSRSAAE